MIWKEGWIGWYLEWWPDPKHVSFVVRDAHVGWVPLYVPWTTLAERPHLMCAEPMTLEEAQHLVEDEVLKWYEFHRREADVVAARAELYAAVIRERRGLQVPKEVNWHVVASSAEEALHNVKVDLCEPFTKAVKTYAAEAPDRDKGDEG